LSYKSCKKGGKARALTLRENRALKENRTPMEVIDKVAWVYTKQGRVPSTRSHGKDTYYLPGGKREAGESDEACLRREISEELAVTLRLETLLRLGTFEAQAHGKAAGILIQMACYAAEYDGELRASAEIAEYVWLRYADREKCGPVDQIIFDWLHEQGTLS
jgi:8-oxo-dGTP diphosphatase